MRPLTQKMGPFIFSRGESSSVNLKIDGERIAELSYVKTVPNRICA